MLVRDPYPVLVGMTIRAVTMEISVEPPQKKPQKPRNAMPLLDI
jgi:hypothetical protein